MLLEKLYCRSGKMMKLEKVLFLRHECFVFVFDGLDSLPAYIKHKFFTTHKVSFRDRIGKIVPKALQ
jgi:hypothetical protein